MELPQVIGVAIGEVERDFDPFPTLGTNCLGLIAQSFGD